jgi:vacuolar-type H+-ATPase subunit D/Vma8
LLSMFAKNKQNLLLLQKQTKTAQRSKVLLEEKLSGLVKEFKETVVEGYLAEQKVSNELVIALDNYQNATSNVSSLSLENFAEKHFKDSQHRKYFLDVVEHKFFGVAINSLNFSMIKLDLGENIRSNIRNSFSGFNHYLAKYIELSNLKLKAKVLSEEIKKTNRLISNVSVRITSLKQDVKSIQQYLMERENETKAVLIKLFN